MAVVARRLLASSLIDSKLLESLRAAETVVCIAVLNQLFYMLVVHVQTAALVIWTVRTVVVILKQVVLPLAAGA